MTYTHSIRGNSCSIRVSQTFLLDDYSNSPSITNYASFNHFAAAKPIPTLAFPHANLQILERIQNAPLPFHPLLRQPSPTLVPSNSFTHTTFMPLMRHFMSFLCRFYVVFMSLKAFLNRLLFPDNQCITASLMSNVIRFMDFLKRIFQFRYLIYKIREPNLYHYNVSHGHYYY